MLDADIQVAIIQLNLFHQTILWMRCLRFYFDFVRSLMHLWILGGYFFAASCSDRALAVSVGISSCCYDLILKIYKSQKFSVQQHYLRQLMLNCCRLKLKYEF